MGAHYVEAVSPNDEPPVEGSGKGEWKGKWQEDKSRAGGSYQKGGETTSG